MRSQVARVILERTKGATVRSVSLYADIEYLVNKTIIEKNIKQEDAKEGSQLYNWFKGNFSFELSDIAELECELNQNILKITYE